ncbi:histidine phosphatase family protein [Corynebacterium sp. zg-331]|uniref:histidine phosphatase family protein n=1 Tax=unclassified Corynebacterium TaxID=2624378 RepID=UPI00128DCE54|nr:MULTISPECIES: histidine phosphatase family protein [unclassified Corynebacterium]MBC3186102.1 histidine phosphatase family protein [Corynebacterium sp. zg-331]MPV52592.1 histidine phosphatase family protein [Corynebacterium sp. zg331]
MTTTIVHLVRHGEVYNPAKILYGRLPGYHLSSRGQSQAARTALSFEGHDVAYLGASPMERVQETAAPLARVTGCEIRTDEDLLEAGNRFEGLRTKGWRSQLWNPVRWPLMVNPTLPSWGEHYEDILARMRAAVERARAAAEGREAVVVSHQLPIVMVQRWAAGKPLAHNPAARRCDLASVTSLIFRGERLVEHRYSEPAREI